ncbi:glycoprotein 3-alpha-L-fucosyltransferase A-like isoform X3 [Magnolia sinica]|uniref:glycoprotein 3-alpha-L-fucosyltransferase A-like isoform X3 n=1 Tax=Magnolia sinica TaxID=86752 RepID=UPI002657BB31|nr:glycoprotein 3-alpha-L-fucosyltransferase A-like isoform X3 [Magnolia sinica]
MKRKSTFRVSMRSESAMGTARIGWSKKMLCRILGISGRTPFWFQASMRSGIRALWGVSLDMILRQIRDLMLHLDYIKTQRQLGSCDPWNPRTTIQRTTLVRHDGGRGYHVVMTTSLSSDVPVGYFSWAEYDLMAPMHPKSESAHAAAFISNCGARNFRLEALDMLEKLNIKIDSYGACHRNSDGRVDKLDTLKRYKFSLAFENSNEEDYVTEKFFQSLVAGAVPVVIGAPNIQDFAPSPVSVLHIRELSDVPSIAKTMKYLAENPNAYNQSVRWKYEGPSDSFKALVDMAAVHSSCRLCIHLATKIREQEEKSARFQKRPCNCTSGPGIVYHLFVRERGRFEMESIFLRSGDLTLKAMKSAVVVKFKSLNHIPIWKQERPESIRGGNELKVYRIYPVGLTQRQALHTFRFSSDDDFSRYVESNPCAKFEVMFV